MRKRDKATQSIGKIILSAAKMFGKVGYTRTSMHDVAQDAGVSESEVQFHFHTKERLLIEAQRSAFRELHRRFVERANRGEKGLPSALDALDSMWLSIRELQVGAPLLVETLSLATQAGPLRKKILTFYEESTDLLTDGIKLVFSNDLERLAIPPRRMANLIRILLEGLLIELAQAHTEQELQQVDQCYADMRALFARFVIVQLEDTPSDLDEGFPLPW